jgi:fructose-1-phosphate kinase PfkB-like protein
MYTVGSKNALSAVKRQANYVGKMSMLTIGASNSARTATALKKKGVAVMEMGRNGWTVSESSIDALLEQLQIVASKDDILVMQCLDSRVFMVID